MRILQDIIRTLFYEMGYRASTGKPIIHLKCKNERIPFDIAGIRAFDYDLSDLDSVEEIKSRLIKTIGALSFDTKSDQNNEDDSDTKEMNGDISQLIPILYEIQDDISQLKRKFIIRIQKQYKQLLRQQRHLRL